MGEYVAVVFVDGRNQSDSVQLKPYCNNNQLYVHTQNLRIFQHIYFYLLDPPNVTLSPETRRIQIGENYNYIFFTCSYDGIKVSNIWTRNGGQPIPTSFNTISGNTNLDGYVTNINDGGTYKCVVTDFSGATVTAVATLIIESESN